MPTIAPYGSWELPITTDLIVQDAVRLGAIQLDGDDLYWVEPRAAPGTLDGELDSNGYDLYPLAKMPIVRQLVRVARYTPSPSTFNTTRTKRRTLCYHYSNATGYEPRGHNRPASLAPYMSQLQAF